MKWMAWLSLMLLIAGCGPAKVFVTDRDVPFADILEMDTGFEYHPLVPKLVRTTETYRIGRWPIYLSDTSEVSLRKNFEQGACYTEITEEIKMLPSTKPKYIRIKMPTFGEGNAGLQFDENGGLRALTVGSDTTAVPKAVADVAQTAIPYVGLVKALGEVLGPINDIVALPEEIISTLNKILGVSGTGVDKNFRPATPEEIDSKLTMTELRDKYCVADSTRTQLFVFEERKMPRRQP